MRQDRTA